jgi:hypothetical protein
MISINEVICAMGWMAKRETPPGGVMTDGQCWWCGKCARSHSKKWCGKCSRVIPKQSIRVGTVVGEMTATKKHTAPWEKSTKNISLKIKSPLSPQVHTADVAQDLRRHMDKSARLANIWFQKGNNITSYPPSEGWHNIPLKNVLPSVKKARNT